MRKILSKTTLFIIAIIMISSVALAKPTKTLGIEKEQWDAILTDLQIEKPDEFLEKITSYAKALKQKRDADHFKKLGSENDPKKKTRENPLWDRRKKYRYMTSLDMDKTDFARLTDIMRDMKEKYNDYEIAKFVPYIALCLNEGMNMNDILFYINRDAFMGTPVDLAIDRLYRELKIELGEL